MISQDLQCWKIYDGKGWGAQSACAWGYQQYQGDNRKEAEKSEEGGAHEGSQPRGKDQGQQVEWHLSCLRGRAAWASEPGKRQGPGGGVGPGTGSPFRSDTVTTCFPGHTI